MEALLSELDKACTTAARIERKLKTDSVLERTLLLVKKGLETKIKEVQLCTV